MHKNLQLSQTNADINRLHAKHGDSAYAPIYGAGCAHAPRLVLVFMNPTARNISAQPNWKGIRAPWIGLKQTWKLFYIIGILSEQLFTTTQQLQPHEWTPAFAIALFTHLSKEGIFSTNLAKATQSDARPLHNKVFTDSREGFLKELQLLKATRVVTFGNQVSSILLNKPVHVSEYRGTQAEKLSVGKEEYTIYPCYYPVGRGWINSKPAIARLKRILRSI